MRLLKTIAVAAIAVAVAILPLAGSAAVAMSAAAGPQMVSAMETADAAAQAMHDDCPEMAKAAAAAQQHGAKPCDQGGHCPMMAFCAAMSVGIAAPAYFAIDYPVLASSPLAFTADDALTAQGGSPPFEPPRV